MARVTDPPRSDYDDGEKAYDIRFLHVEESDAERADEVEVGTALASYSAQIGVPVEFLENLGITSHPKYPKDIITFTFPQGWEKHRNISGRVLLKEGRSKGITVKLRDKSESKLGKFFWTTGKQPPSGAHPLWPSPDLDREHNDVWFCEGESDTIVLNYLGFDSYTIGSCKNRISLYEARVLKAMGVQRVFVTFDADSPGHDGSQQLVADLVNLDIKAYRVDLSALCERWSLEYVKDVRDLYTKLGKVALSDALIALRDDSLRVRDIRMAERLKDIELPEWVWDGLISEGSLILLAGAPKAGKTTFLFKLIAAMLKGDELLGRAVKKRRVLYYSEMPPSTDKTWFDNYLAAHYIDGEVFIRHAVDEDFQGKSWPEIVMVMAEEIEQLNINYVFIDTATEWLHFSKDEMNSVPDVKDKLRPLQRFCQRLGITVQVNHHQPKYDSRPLGSVAFAAVVDSILTMEKVDGITELAVVGRSGGGLVRFDYVAGEYKIIQSTDDGESSESKTKKEQLLEKIPYDPGRCTKGDLLRELSHIGQQTMSNYLGELKKDNLISCDGTSKALRYYRDRGVSIKMVSKD